MDFQKIIGQTFLKDYFQKVIASERVPNTQLFVGEEGVGTLPMALAFADKLLCGDNQNCQNKVRKFIHPDLHFIYPTVSGSIKKPDSDIFLPQWREFLTRNPYASLYDWMQFLNVPEKQGQIRVADAELILKKAAVKPYEAGYKIIIIWMVEKMNEETANKLLKILEEPPEDTKFILIAEKTDNIISTIISRCQVHRFNLIPVEEIKQELLKRFELKPEQAVKIAVQSNGNWNKVLQFVEAHNTDDDFQKLFIAWVRTAFSALKDKQAIRKLISWSEQIASKGRETQKQFLQFALESFRQAMLINYQAPSLVYFDFSANQFDLKKLAPFVHSNNIQDIYNAITEAIYHIERNASSKIIFLELSVNLTKYIHKNEKTF